MGGHDQRKAAGGCEGARVELTEAYEEDRHLPPYSAPGFWAKLGELVPAYTNSPTFTTRPALYDLDERFRMMDRFGDYVQVLRLSWPPIEDFAEGQLAADLARLANDEMAGLVQKYPDRFVGFAASITLDDMDAALTEMDRSIRQLGAFGVQIFTNLKGHPLDEDRFAPFFQKMADLDKPIWVHPTRTADHADYPSETQSKYAPHLKLGWPYETAVFISRLILSGIMERHPKLRVLTHHAGGIIPHLAGRLVLHHDQPEQRKAAGVGEEFDVAHTYALYKRFYGDTVFSGAHHPLDCAIEFYGVDTSCSGRTCLLARKGANSSLARRSRPSKRTGSTARHCSRATPATCLA